MALSKYTKDVMHLAIKQAAFTNSDENVGYIENAAEQEKKKRSTALLLQRKEVEDHEEKAALFSRYTAPLQPPGLSHYFIFRDNIKRWEIAAFPLSTIFQRMLQQAQLLV